MDKLHSIVISDKVYDKQKFINTTDIQFRELVSNDTEETELPSVEDLFLLYEQLFYVIPKEGTYSHTTLVEQSSAYLGLNNSENIDIQALLDEITSLREQVYNNDLLLKQIQSSNANI